MLFGLSILCLSVCKVRQAIHVTESGITVHSSCSDTVSALYTKQVFDLKPQVLKVINKGVRVMIYNGDADMACNFLGDEWFVEDLGIKQIHDYKAWFSKDKEGIDQVAGYVRQFEGISFVTVKGAGHYVPKDKPKASFEMYQRLLENKLF